MRSMAEIVADYVVDESKLKPYTLPDPLVCEDGTPVGSAFDWMTRRRPEIMRIFMQEEYGFVPPRPQIMRFETLTVKEDALDNTAVRKEIRLHFAMDNGRRHAADMLLYLPKNAPGPVPVFVGLNFKGMIAWIIAGLPWDAVHGTSNLIAGLLLIVPLIKLLRLCEKQFRNEESKPLEKTDDLDQ